MRFGTIGGGAVALGFAREALRAGHQVVLSNRRGPDSLADLVAELGNGASAATAAEAASLDYVLFAVPWPHVETHFEACRRGMEGSSSMRRTRSARTPLNSYWLTLVTRARARWSLRWHPAPGL